MTTRALEEIASGIEEKARGAGADEAECVVRRIRSVRIEVKNGRPEGVKRAEDISAALRVLVDGKREGFVFTTAPGERTYAALARDAIDGARLLPCREENRFSHAEAMGPSEGLYDSEGIEFPFEGKVLLAAEMEEAVLADDQRVDQAHKPSFSQQHRATAIASGRRTWSYEDSMFSLSVQAVARSGEESQAGYDYSVSRRYADLDPAKVGRNAASEAVQLLGGLPPDSGKFPGVFPPKVALDLLGALMSSFSAEEMQKGRSRLADKRGEKLFSKCLTIVDDGTIPWRTGSVPFDDERVPPVPRPLVEEGVVSGCMHTLKTAARWGEKPTGNASRGSLTGTPVPGPANLFIVEDPDPLDTALFAGRVMKFNSLMGIHMIDGVSGDFSLGAAGFILEDGQTVRPFRNGTVSGNLFDLMAGLRAVGNDLTFYGSLGSPTLVFESVIVSGK